VSSANGLHQCGAQDGINLPAQVTDAGAAAVPPAHVAKLSKGVENTVGVDLPDGRQRRVAQTDGMDWIFSRHGQCGQVDQRQSFAT
jgi:hypothetical protein